MYVPRFEGRQFRSMNIEKQDQNENLYVLLMHYIP